jgi:putative transposase
MALRSEKILIKKNNKDFKHYKSACRITTAIYNCANYYIRQSFFNRDYVNWQSADKYLRQKHNGLYNALPCQSSQSIVRKLGDDWDSFFKGIKAYNIDPSKFKERPKTPKYKRKLGTFTSTFQSMKVVNNEIHFPKRMNLQPLAIRCCDNQPFKAKIKEQVVKEVRIKPQNDAFFVEVVYHKKIVNKICLDKKNVLSVDFGVNNLLTIVTNQDNLQPILINGNVIKSINQRYNKSKAFYQAKNNKSQIDHIGLHRHCAIKDIFHKMSHFVQQYCLTNNIGTVILGKNKDMKQNINIGKANNQTFVSIPFNLLIEFITYKCNEIGVEVILQEESYTSLSDALAYDILPIYDEDNYVKYNDKI